MKHLAGLLILGTVVFGQNAPDISGRFLQPRQLRQMRSGNRTLLTNDNVGSVDGRTRLPFGGKRYERKRGYRVFLFEDNTGNATGAPKNSLPANDRSVGK